MITFIRLNEILEDPYLIFISCVFCTLILIFISIISILFYTDLYYPYIKKPICKYIRERNERLMIKISSNLKLRRNSKTKYLKLV